MIASNHATGPMKMKTFSACQNLWFCAFDRRFLTRSFWNNTVHSITDESTACSIRTSQTGNRTKRA